MVNDYLPSEVMRLVAPARAHPRDIFHPAQPALLCVEEVLSAEYGYGGAMLG
jgi:hypothetical protein